MTAASVAGLPPYPVMPEPEWPSNLDPSVSKGTEEASCDEESVRLMLRVKEGDVRAFERLVELHQGVMIGAAARMLGNLDDAHDIAQQVFIRVWKSAPRYEPTAKFTTWLFTIMRNLVFNETRRRSRRKETPLESDHDAEDGPQRQFADPGAVAPDHQVQHEELEKALDKAISALPEKQRLAVVLRRYEEMPYEQICEVLKMSLPAVKSLLFRARAEMRKHLAAFLDDEEPGE
jgi:RNA polymerase sigma-70 factor (ECF subfamily)